MIDLTAFRPMHPDELMIGWCADMAYYNAFFGKTPTSDFCVSNLDDKVSFSKLLHRPDGLKDLRKIVKLIRDAGYRFPDAYTVLMRNTVYGYMTVANPPGVNAYRSEAFLGTYPLRNWLLSELRICPKCGYYRTWHQAPGVRVCAVHDCPLFIVRVKSRIHDFPRYADAYKGGIPESVNEESDLPYARFIYDMYHAGEEYDCSVVKALLPDFPDDIRRTDEAKRFITIIKGLIKVFGSYAAFSTAARSIPCLKLDQSKSENVHKFFDSNGIARNGSIRAQLASLGFAVAEEPAGYFSSVRATCEKCGKMSTTSPYVRIFVHTGCSCARTKLNTVFKDFRAIRVFRKNSVSYVTVEHLTCGNTYTVRSTNCFKTHCPFCSTTQPYKNAPPERRAAYAEKHVQDLTDQYKVLSYTSYNAPLWLRHERCGTEYHNTSLHQFDVGRGRCPFCYNRIRPDYVVSCVNKCVSGFSAKVLPDTNSRTTILLCTAEGKEMEKPANLVMQELSRPTPSKLFPERLFTPPYELSTAALIYEYIKTKNCGRCRQQILKKFTEKSERSIDVALKRLLSLGLVKRDDCRYIAIWKT